VWIHLHLVRGWKRLCIWRETHQENSPEFLLRRILLRKILLSSSSAGPSSEAPQEDIPEELFRRILSICPYVV